MANLSALVLGSNDLTNNLTSDTVSTAMKEYTIQIEVKEQGYLCVVAECEDHALKMAQYHMDKVREFINQNFGVTLNVPTEEFRVSKINTHPSLKDQ